METPPILLVAAASQAEDWIAINSDALFTDSIVTHIQPEKNQITIGQIRQLKQSLITLPKNSQLIILHQFHTARSEAQNALLKTLEEKPSSVSVLMITQSRDSILPTIQSRSRIITIEQEEILPDQVIQDLLQTYQSQPEAIFAHPTMQNLDADAAISVCDQIILFLRRCLSSDPTVAGMLSHTLHIRSQITTNNLNPQLAVDRIVIRLSQSQP